MEMKDQACISSLQIMCIVSVLSWWDIVGVEANSKVINAARSYKCMGMQVYFSNHFYYFISYFYFLYNFY